jgi:Xaa-Pro aminopeptidase
MKPIAKYIFIAGFLSCFFFSAFSQSENNTDNQPTDQLTAAFHAGRRQALRALMPANSVMVIFSYPEEVFSRDVDYVYHPNPDLYYYSGYKEPNAVLFIFKEMQPDGDSSYNELFFVQHRDPAAEQWTGKRLGVEGVRKVLGFKRVYNGEAFEKFPLDLKKYKLVYDNLPDTLGEHAPGSLKSLVSAVMRNGGLVSEDNALQDLLARLYSRGNAKNLPRYIALIKTHLNSESFQKNVWIQALIANPDSATLERFKKNYEGLNAGPFLFNKYTNEMRGIKTPEEIALIKKSVEISSIAHAEAMRAVNPKMSERELEGIMLYVHNKYGAEDEGYPPIVGAGANGCILHYEENDAPEVNNQLVLMDVGAMYHGYSADVTRTFPANGKFSEEQRIIYQLVYDAQEEAFTYCHEGVSFDSLEAKTTHILAEGLLKLGLIQNAAEVKKYYPHGMTHHLGLDVHDKGTYNLLRENMVITVEPGIYIPAGSPVDKKWWNIGVRIEDDVLIGKNGYTLLSIDAPRKWQDVEKTLAEQSIFDKGNFPPLQ